MPYKLLATRPFDRSLKRLSVDARQHIEMIIFDLENEPQKGEALRQKFKGFWSLHTRFHNTDYRVVYDIDERNWAINLYYVSSRENFYRELERLRLKAT